ncbi:MAG: NAD-dependent epimerase/dehydratase family protein [Patescibacteria group bacterium]|nr:NAD-dependent epimerase/dehydratase family protein [Patescibacteria group bacterium]
MTKKTETILITGHLGFVGKHTVRRLSDLGHKVVGYDIIEGNDIRDYDKLLKMIEPGMKILHLAAVSTFWGADKDPIEAFTTNALGTKNIIQAAKAKGAERVVYASTGSVYMPIVEQPPLTENHRAMGNSHYGCSKRLGELYVLQADSPYVILRYAHLYGQGKEKEGAVGGFIDRMRRGMAPVLYGGKQSNDFCYIKDVVQANELALFTPNLNEIYNIGTGEETTTEDIFKIMRKVSGYNKDFEYQEQRLVDASRFFYDISKAQKLLGYNPQWSLKKGIEDMWNLI